MPVRLDDDRLARSRMYAFLARGFATPDEGTPRELDAQWTALTGSLPALLDETTGAAGIRLTGLADADLQAAYVHCFGHTISKDCPPYETEYGQAHIFQKTHQLADIAGFYRAFGLELAADLHDRADALTVELEFMQFLHMKEAYGAAHGHDADRLALCREARIEFLREHLGRWVCGFARRLESRAAGTVYGELARLLAAFVTAEIVAAGLSPDEVAGPDVLSEGTEAPGCGGCTAAATPPRENDSCASPI